MRPIDETWEALGWMLLVSGPSSPTLSIARFSGFAVDREQEEARAKLAAEAPAMARMLLAKQWLDVNGGESKGEDGWCPWCFGSEPAHRPTCEWHALMRRLGERS